MAEQLAVMSERGSYPRELLDPGIKDYRLAFFKPYQFIYLVIGRDVVVFVVADARRNLQSLLARRLLDV